MTIDRPNWFAPDDEPKSNGGVKIIIPSIEELHRFVVEETNSSGDKTRGELQRDYLNWLVGENEEEPGTLIWQAEMDGVLVDKYELNLHAGYSPTSGEWADFVTFLWASDVATSWDIADKGEQIRDILKAKGLNASLEIDHMEEYTIHIKDEADSFVAFHLGHTNLDEAINWYGEEDALKNGNNPIILRPGRESGELSLDLERFTQQLKFYQQVAPQAISALYEAFELSEPSVTIELSKERSGYQP